MHVKSCRLILAVILPVMLLAGCSDTKTQSAAAAVMADASIREAPTTADPQAAIKEIYAGFKEVDAVDVENWRIEEVIGIPSGRAKEVYARYSSAKSGLADMIIVKPHEIWRDEVREMLYQYKEKRVREFENYDILDAYSIAQGAIVYDQGEYSILLMFSDNEAAQNIIDKYIPQ